MVTAALLPQSSRNFAWQFPSWVSQNVRSSYLSHMIAATSWTAEYWHLHRSECKTPLIDAHNLPTCDISLTSSVQILFSLHFIYSVWNPYLQGFTGTWRRVRITRRSWWLWWPLNYFNNDSSFPGLFNKGIYCLIRISSRVKYTNKRKLRVQRIISSALEYILYFYERDTLLLRNLRITVRNYIIRVHITLRDAF